jgi:hypothetical protein
MQQKKKVDPDATEKVEMLIAQLKQEQAKAIAGEKARGPHELSSTDQAKLVRRAAGAALSPEQRDELLARHKAQEGEPAPAPAVIKVGEQEIPNPRIGDTLEARQQRARERKYDIRRALGQTPRRPIYDQDGNATGATTDNVE